jgi:predicted enzyme related to lactoylglutathione lyase
MDVMSSDIDTARAFYEALFGWTSEDAGEEFGHYINFSRDGEMIAGGMANTPEMETPDAWSVYLAVADAEATQEQAVAAGATVAVPAMAVGELGVMAVFQDPGGAFIGVWQAKEHAGFAVRDEPGSPCWFELHTRDFAASVAFYEAVFGWDTELQGDTDDFRYTVATNPGTIVGIMDATSFLPDGAPAHWSVYWETEDVAASLKKAEELGGSTLQGPDDTPYGVLATGVDPTGAVYKLRTTPAEG